MKERTIYWIVGGVFGVLLVVLVLAVILEYTWSLIRARRAAGEVSAGDPPASSGAG